MLQQKIKLKKPSKGGSNNVTLSLFEKSNSNKTEVSNIFWKVWRHYRTPIRWNFLIALYSYNKINADKSIKEISPYFLGINQSTRKLLLRIYLLRKIYDMRKVQFYATILQSKQMTFAHSTLFYKGRNVSNRSAQVICIVKLHAVQIW